MTVITDQKNQHLSVSTAHITESDNVILTDQADFCENTRVCHEGGLPITVSADRYGYWVLLSTSITEPEFLQKLRDTRLSEDFANLLKFACEKGCSALRIDRDADVIDGLPTHDW